MDPNGSTLESRLERYYSAYNLMDAEDEEVPTEKLPRMPERKHREELPTNLPVAYMSRIETIQPTRRSFLWDSGATRTIIGRGDMYDRLIGNYEVLYHDSQHKSIHEEDLHKRQKLERGSMIKVMVASGDEVLGTELDRVDIKVTAEEMRHEDSQGDESVIESVKLSLLNPIISNDILTDVISESHFMQTNPGFTMITQGKNKYLLYGWINITVTERDGQPPMRIDLRYHEGAHYLDLHAVVRNRDQVRWHNECINTDTRAEQSSGEELPAARINTMRAFKLSPQEQIEFSQIKQAQRMYVPADKVTAYTNIASADLGVEERDEDAKVFNVTESKVYQQYKQTLASVHSVFESTETTDQDKINAVDILNKITAEMNVWLASYKSKAKAMGVTTRRAAQSQSQSMSQSQSQQSDSQQQESQTAQDDDAQASQSSDALRQRAKQAAEHKQWRVRFDNTVSAHVPKLILSETPKSRKKQNPAASQTKKPQQQLPEPDGAPLIESENESSDSETEKHFDPDAEINEESEPVEQAKHSASESESSSEEENDSQDSVSDEGAQATQTHVQATCN
jgi:hypothetical protein